MRQDDSSQNTAEGARSLGVFQPEHFDFMVFAGGAGQREKKTRFISAGPSVRSCSPGHSGNKHPFRDCGHETAKPVAAFCEACVPSRYMNKRGVVESLLERVHDLLNSCFKKRYINPRALNGKRFGKMYVAVLNHR